MFILKKSGNNPLTARHFRSICFFSPELRLSFFLLLLYPKSEESIIGSNIKMQIKVKCDCGEINCLEWAVVELQGVVEAQPSFKDRIQNLEIGILCRPSDQVLSFALSVSDHLTVNLFLFCISLPAPLVALELDSLTLTYICKCLV